VDPASHLSQTLAVQEHTHLLLLHEHNSPLDTHAGAPRRTLEVNPQQALVARECFRRVAGGESVRSVARWMRSLTQDNRGGRTWAPFTVRRLLSCPTYIARHEPEGEGIDPITLPAGKWPAIIDDDLWRATQADMAPGTKLPRRADTKHVLSGFLRCARPGCEARTTGDIGRGRRARYRCMRNVQEKRCSGTMPAAEIERQALRRLANVLKVSLAGDLRRDRQQQ